MLSFDSGDNQILAEARRLAHTYGVDQTRVRPILKQLVGSLPHDCAYSKYRLPYDVRWRPPLSASIVEDALIAFNKPKLRLAYLDLESDDEPNDSKAEDALVLFEEKGFDEVARRVCFVEYLNHPDTPFYSLDELAELAKLCSLHLMDN